MIASNYPNALDLVDCYGLTSLNHALLSKNDTIMGIIFGYKLGAEVDKNLSEMNDTSTLKKAHSFSNTVSKCCALQELGEPFIFAKVGDLSKIQDLLKEGLDVNATNDEGWSLLHFAVKSENEELVKLLIDNGAQADLATNKDRITALHIAATGNNRKVMQILLDAGANLSDTDAQGSTALHYAAANTTLFSAQFLIEKGSDLTHKNHLNLSPFSIIASQVREQCKNKGELNLDTMQYLMFASLGVSLLATYFEGNIPLEVLATMIGIIPLGIVLRSTKTLSEKILMLGMISLNYIPFNYLPFSRNLIMRKEFTGFLTMTKTMLFWREAIKGIHTAWKYRHIETARAIRNAIILGTNALGVIATPYLEQRAREIQQERHHPDPDRLFEQRAREIEQERLNNEPHHQIEWLFQRKHSTDKTIQSMEKTQKAYHIINNSEHPNIYFEGDSLEFDRGGTCSAMVLDFVARMNSECAKLPESDPFINCVQGKSPYYISNTEDFTSVQSAYNSIRVDKLAPDLSLGKISPQKMQSLANYHDMKLIPVTKTFTDANANLQKEEIKGIIEGLPLGSYIIRRLDPSDNSKLESIGHTMGFIKREKELIFYDNGKGASRITGDLAEGVMKSISYYGFPVMTIYKAECPSEGCTNLAEATTKAAI